MGMSFMRAKLCLAGRPAVARGTLSTAADPGLFAADGFEGPLAAKLDGSAQVVTNRRYPRYRRQQVPAGAQVGERALAPRSHG